LKISKFLLSYGIFTFLLGLSAYLIDRSYTGQGLLIPKFWVIFGAIAILTLLAYIFSWIGIRKGGEFSIVAMMGGILLKLLFCMVLVLVYLLKFKVNDIIFVANFISLYFLFTAFEVYALLCNLRHQNKDPKNTY
jgi:choline-glycine betaine transporter